MTNNLSKCGTNTLFIQTHLFQVVTVRVPVLVVEMSQDAMVGLREADGCERLHGRLSLLRRVRRAVCGILTDRQREQE